MKILLGLLLEFLSANAADARRLVDLSAARNLTALRNSRNFQVQSVEYADDSARHIARRMRGDK